MSNLSWFDPNHWTHAETQAHTVPGISAYLERTRAADTAAPKDAPEPETPERHPVKE